MDSSNNPPSIKGDTSSIEEFLQALRDIQNINVDKLTAHLSQSSKHTNPDVSETLMTHSGHALESQKRETDRLRRKLEEDKGFRQEYLNVFGTKEIKDVNKLIDNMGDEIKRLEEENKKLDEKNKSLEEEMRKAISEKDNAMTRLRRQMGNPETEDTTCVADMSDQNQPNKLEKRYQELYDHQWADAFEMLTKSQIQTDNSAIEMLLKVLIECHNFTKMKAEKQMNELLRTIYGDPTAKVGDAIKRQLKNARKLMDVGIAADQNSKFIQECEAYMIGKVRYLHDKTMKKYIIECFQICWLMAIQDPPSVFGNEAKYAENFDTSIYKPFTTSGTRVDFVVLPPILVHEGGPVLAKGVAQPIQEKTEQIKTYRNVRDDEGTIGIREQPIGGATEHYPVKLSSTITRPLASDGQINTTLPHTTKPSLSSLATKWNMYPLSMSNQRRTTEMSQSTPTSYQMELVGTSYKQNTNTDYGNPHFTIRSTPTANAKYVRESENKATRNQQGIISYTGGASTMTERVSMNESKRSHELLSPRAGSARTSYEGEKTSQLHHSTARFENETRGHLSKTEQTEKPIHVYKRGNYESLQEYEKDEFVSFIYMYEREGESVTRTHFYNKFDRYLSLYHELLQQRFGWK